MPPATTPKAQLPRSAADQRAQRLALAQALEGVPGLSWQQLSACPDWLALPRDQRQALCTRAGAWWLAASLRACIDGKRLTRVCELLGEEALATLRSPLPPALANALEHAPRPLLPPAEDMPDLLSACGRALLAWQLPPDLRAPLLQHLNWPLEPNQQSNIARHRAWATQALQAALKAQGPDWPDWQDEAAALHQPAADDQESVPADTDTEPAAAP